MNETREGTRAGMRREEADGLGDAGRKSCAGKETANAVHENIPVVSPACIGARDEPLFINCWNECISSSGPM